jgi:hypothetical protein
MLAYDPDVRRLELASIHVEALSDVLVRLCEDPNDSKAWTDFARRVGHLVIFVRTRVRHRSSVRE